MIGRRYPLAEVVMLTRRGGLVCFPLMVQTTACAVTNAHLSSLKNTTKKYSKSRADVQKIRPKRRLVIFLFQIFLSKLLFSLRGKYGVQEWGGTAVFFWQREEQFGEGNSEGKSEPKGTGLRHLSPHPLLISFPLVPTQKWVRA